MNLRLTLIPILTTPQREQQKERERARERESEPLLFENPELGACCFVVITRLDSCNPLIVGSPTARNLHG